MTVAVRSDTPVEFYIEFGAAPDIYTAQTAPQRIPSDPYAAGFYATQLFIGDLNADTSYFYRIQYRLASATDSFAPGPAGSFHTQRPPGSTFVFVTQGDSHPERANTMFHPQLYTQTLRAAATEHPDFYITNGDDFSVDTLRTPYTQSDVTGRYTLQLGYFNSLGGSVPLFLGTGNHEETSLSNYNLPTDTANSNQVPIWAQNARNLYYASPAPNDPNTGSFYTGNQTTLPGIGILRDYYAWQWGDALFVVIDPYWSSPAQVDTGLGGQNGTGSRTNDKWSITHGDAQYQWLKQTLEQSKAKWKFIFAHHVMGTGRGGAAIANQFEWGGNNNNGTFGFPANRPTWPLPIHQLMVANHVTVFFQAHDHLFAHEVVDGVTYQSLPNPADNTYTAFNADAYSGDVLPNSGYTKVTVSPSAVKVDYVRQWLPSDERAPDRVSGNIAFSYTIQPGPITPTIASVKLVNGTSSIAPNTWVEIKGSDFAPAGTSRVWQTSDFTNGQLPTNLDGVRVAINGKPAYVYYVSPTQINVLTPPDPLPSAFTVQVTTPGANSPGFTATGSSLAPALFQFGASPYVASVHSDGSYIGPETLYPGLTTPAKPGETILLFGHGFGPTSIPVASGASQQSGTLAPTPVISIGGKLADVLFAGLVAPGEFQFNVVVPPSSADGDLPVVIQYGNAATPPGARIRVKQ